MGAVGYDWLISHCFDINELLIWHCDWHMFQKIGEKNFIGFTQALK